MEVTPPAGPVEYLVDSQFDVNYQITFIGAQGSPLEGMAGSTEGISSLGTLVPQVGDTFIRGDSDGDGFFNGLVDALFLLAFAFQCADYMSLYGTVNFSPCLAESADGHQHTELSGLPLPA